MKRSHLAGSLTLLALPWLAACSDGGSDGPEISRPLACLTDPACHTVMISAHRGYKKHHPENSLAAMRAAAEVGAEFVEIDVRHTSDEVLVLMHDDTVDRTTDGSGLVSDHSWAEIQQLTLTGGEDGNPESTHVPTYQQAMALADELGILLYLDQKTSRTDLVLAAIQAGPWYHVNLIRDDPATVIAEYAEDPNLYVMPAIGDEAQLAEVRAAIDRLYIVEVGASTAQPDLIAAINAAGIKAQQDLLGTNDIRAALGDYAGWKAVIDTGIYLPQTDLPNLLVPAVRQLNETGEFPESGPPDPV